MTSKVKRDIRLDLGMMRHLKIRKLRAKTGAEGVVSLVTLWLYAGDHHPDGDLSGFDVEDLELAADWSGEPGELAAALVEVRLVDEIEEGGGYVVHDWPDHQPYVMGSQARSEKAKKAARAKHGRSPSKLDGCSKDATSTDRASSEPAPYPSPDPSPSPSPDPTESAQAPSAPAAPAASPVEPEVSIVGMATAARAKAADDVGVEAFDEVSALEQVGRPPPAPIDPPILTIPTSGKGAEEWPVHASFVAEMERAYPAVDVRAELRKMRAWAVANPRNRKTKQGMTAFINRWLAKCQDRGGASPFERPPARASPGGGGVAERLAQAAREAAEREQSP